MKKPLLRASLTCFSLAVFFAALRWILSVDAVPGERIRFEGIHDVTWDPETKVLTRTGNDPYLRLDLSEVATPIRQISFVFIGAFLDTEGSIYVFGSSPKTAEKWPDPQIARIYRSGGGFTAQAKFDDATMIRVDLPDFLLRSIELRRMIVHTPYVNFDSWPFRLALCFFALGVVTAIWGWRRA